MPFQSRQPHVLSHVNFTPALLTSIFHQNNKNCVPAEKWWDHSSIN